MISLNIEFRQQARIKGLDTRIDKAVQLAQKEAVRALKAETARAVSAQYWLSQALVKKHISEQQKGILVRSERLSLDKYKLSPRKPSRKRILHAAVRRDGGMKSLGRRAFIWGGHPFARTSRARLPIKKLVGPAVPQLVDNDGVLEQIQQKGQDTFSKRFKHYISRLGGS